jgi:hypothetical protein
MQAKIRECFSQAHDKPVVIPEQAKRREESAFDSPVRRSSTSVTPTGNHPLDYVRTLSDRTCTDSLFHRN